MKQAKQWFGEILLVSLIINLFFILLFPQIPTLRLVERKVRDNLMKTRSSSINVDEIPVEIVNLDSLDFRNISESETHHCQLVEFLLIKAKAEVVILNLPRVFAVQIDEDDQCIKRLIKANVIKDIVLVSYTEPLIQDSTQTITDYSYLLPHDYSSVEDTFLRKSTVGFFEYHTDYNNFVSFSSLFSLTSPSRTIFLRGQFWNINKHQKTDFESALLLAVKYFLDSSGGKTKILNGNFKKVIFQYFGRTGTFNNTGIEEICPQSDYCSESTEVINQFKDKIILVGITDKENPIESALPMKSIWGDLMPAVEIQANIITSFLTDNFYSLPPEEVKILIVLTVGLLINCLTFFITNKHHYFYFFLIYTLFVLVYYIVIYNLFFTGLMLPVIFPPLIWVATGMLTLTYFKFRRHKIWMAQKLQELEEFKKAEKDAALVSAKRLLQRVATDIHDGPLQDLKLVMDNLEEILFTKEYQQINQVLDNLEDMGKQIRRELYSTSQLAKKMGITPQLRKGLSKGIKNTLSELIEQEKLTLKLIEDIEILSEPYLNSDWLALREDIFRFFKEAINNVRKHAQPPIGSATKVEVCLQKEGYYCSLTIKNDGDNNLIPVTGSGNFKKGGYGTKIMKTIAEELPEGYWHRKLLPTGEIEIYLRWNMEYFNE